MYLIFTKFEFIRSNYASIILFKFQLIRLIRFALLYSDGVTDELTEGRLLVLQI